VLEMLVKNLVYEIDENLWFECIDDLNKACFCS
jgi:hypothetical protein